MYAIPIPTSLSLLIHIDLLDIINDMLHTPQSESEQRPHKLSYIVSVKGEAAEKVVSQLEDKLQAAGMISSNHAPTCSAAARR